ncbi:hypothetical protein [Arcticibacter eurypsychrophilus]|nr:hypothetical protein [Arcticibacter eurypsychrophilus]
MLLNNTSYGTQVTGLANSNPRNVLVCLTVRSPQYNLPYDSLQSSKDFIN